MTQPTRASDKAQELLDIILALGKDDDIVKVLILASEREGGLYDRLSRAYKEVTEE